MCDVLSSFVRDACGPSKAAAAAGTLKLQTTFHHKFLKTIAVEATTAFAGTDNEPLLVRSWLCIHTSSCLQCRQLRRPLTHHALS